MRLVHFLGLWAAASVPVSLLTGLLLSTGQGATEPVPVRAAARR